MLENLAGMNLGLARYENIKEELNKLTKTNKSVEKLKSRLKKVEEIIQGEENESGRKIHRS